MVGLDGSLGVLVINLKLLNNDCTGALGSGNFGIDTIAGGRRSVSFTLRGNVVSDNAASLSTGVVKGTSLIVFTLCPRMFLR